VSVEAVSQGGSREGTDTVWGFGGPKGTGDYLSQCHGKGTQQPRHRYGQRRPMDRQECPECPSEIGGLEVSGSSLKRQTFLIGITPFVWHR
jgi:hypothetical protein